MRILLVYWSNLILMLTFMLGVSINSALCQLQPPMSIAFASDISGNWEIYLTASVGKLPAGETILRIAVREDATKLDAVFVTSKEGATVPDQANVRLPTDKDREMQIQGLPVDAKGKVATTWGSLKQAYR